MAEKIVITIGREFGSEGHEIGRLVAEHLGIGFYDKDLLYKIAEQSGIEASELALVDEKVTNRFLQPYMAFGYNYNSLNDKLFKLQSQMIREVAEKESCIIIGRLADYILRENPDCFKVFVYAPIEERIHIIKEKHHLTEEAAKKLIKRMDTARNNYYTYYSNGKWNVKEGKDLLVNRATFGVAGCAQIIEAMAKLRLVNKV